MSLVNKIQGSTRGQNKLRQEEVKFQERHTGTSKCIANNLVLKSDLGQVGNGLLYPRGRKGIAADNRKSKTMYLSL